ncbi:MAG TPA: ABC transporter permease [Firmicutes bacterium]|nr:ABC transporter permease [Bacillota bacterium]
MSDQNQAVLRMKACWDPRMFLEGLRQLRVFGVLYLILLEVAVLLASYEETRYLHSYTGFSLSFRVFAILIALAAMAAAGLMTLFLFRFQNRREGGDFYHSLPNTRTSLFTSFFTAVLAWVGIGILAAGVTSMVGLFVFCPYGTLVEFPSAAEVASCLFFALAAGLFVAAVTALAMGFTGTMLSNVLVAALFALGPRLLVMVYFRLLESAVPILPPMGDDSLFDLHYNPLFFLFSYDWYTMDGGVVTAALYSLVVGALYTLLAWLVFRRRRSETAGQAAPNRILQAVFRLMIAMLICLFPCAGIIEGSWGFFECLVLYLIAAAAYFLYELITTRRVRNLLRAAPALGILAVMNIAFVGSFSAVRTVVCAQTPSADEIQSVTFRLNQSSHFLDARAGSIPLEDETVRRLVSSRLSSEAGEVARGSDDFLYEPTGQRTVVDIHTDSGILTRRLSFRESEWRQIEEKIQQTEQYRSAYMDLPPVGDGFSFTVTGCSAAQNAALYDCLQEDVRAMGFDAWHELVNDATRYANAPLWEDSKAGICLSASVYMRGQVPANGTFWSGGMPTASAGVSLPLSTALPRTLELYLQYSAAHAPDADRLRQAMEDASAYDVRFSGIHLKDGDNEDAFLNITLNDYYPSQQAEVRRFLDELLAQYEAGRGEPVDLTRPAYGLEIYTWDNGVLQVYFNVEADTLPPVPAYSMDIVPTEMPME